MKTDAGIPNGWDFRAVEALKSPDARSLAAGPFGSSISSKFFVEEGVPVIRGGNLSLGKERFIADGFAFITPSKADEFKGAQVKAGDLVFTCWGTLGQVGIIPADGPYPVYVISNKQLKFRPDPKKASSRFLYYYFASPSLRQRFNDVAIGAAVPGINLGILKREKIPLPQLAEQQKIAAILTAYDDLIENNRQRIALLEKMAEEIYREWFVRLRFPGHEHTPVHKGVPEGWEVQRLSDLVSLEYGKAMKADERSGQGFPVVGSSGIVGRHSEALVKGPGIVVGRKGNVGSVIWLDEDFYPIDTTYYIKTEVNLPWIYYLLQQMSFLNADAAVPGLNRKQAYSNIVFMPPSNLIEKFAKLVTPMFDQVRNLSGINDKLGATRDLLLNRLISGKLRVDDLDIQFPPSMQQEAA